MSAHVPKSLFDYGRHRFDVAVECRSCGRVSVFETRDVILHYQAHGWSVALPLDASHFVCRCRSRDVLARATPIEARPRDLPPPRPVLRPLYSKPGRHSG
ncbi:hypothetical protein [Sphingomonas jatrophae]|uniref:Uncharacterized protein n=1 Tax=Sphingomonas jatrophae TaxID=1166337 RepID=A0A1I6K6R7_9SPHN|nr:hypothetical protein [Sphingomonas jatrophae]SFR86919.1 hypothetical protein SAMN05192580_1388 [Sphingomonas jatrophae]